MCGALQDVREGSRAGASALVARLSGRSRLEGIFQVFRKEVYRKRSIWEEIPEKLIDK